MTEPFDSRDELQPALFDRQGFEEIVEENDEPAAEEREQRGEEKGRPHALTMAQGIETFHRGLARRRRAISHPSNDCRRARKRYTAVCRRLELKNRRKKLILL